MITISEVTESTITVFVPIEIRRRNGRPKIVLPDDGSGKEDVSRDQAAAVVIRAIARAWDWRRRLERGQVGTLQDLANAERVTLPFVSRFIRLAYLAPAVLDRIVARKGKVAVSLERIAELSSLPWPNQAVMIFDAPDRDARSIPLSKQPTFLPEASLGNLS
jgi:hypothetical protein